MTANIIAILAVIAGLVWWAVKRKNDAVQQHRERQQQIDEDIVCGNGLAATAHADADLAQLERLRTRKGNPGQPGGDACQKG